MLKMIEDSSTGRESGRTMCRISRQSVRPVEAGRFEDVLGDVDQPGVEQDGVEAHGPPEVHDDDDPESVRTASPNQSMEPIPKAFEGRVDQAVLRCDLEHLLEQQCDGDRRQDHGEEDQGPDEA